MILCDHCVYRFFQVHKRISTTEKTPGTVNERRKGALHIVIIIAPTRVGDRKQRQTAGRNPIVRIRFITSTPLNIRQGSGTFAGIAALAEALRNNGSSVEFLTPSFRVPVYTLQRVLFNELLRLRQLSSCDVTVGFDMDGYAVAQQAAGLRVAFIKGVIADEMRFETGFTRLTMAIQAACERAHVQAANLVITTSRYSAERIQALYGLTHAPHIVPELIDLQAWQQRLESAPCVPARGKFIVLCVCRFYPRKRVDVLLRAAARLRSKLPGLEVRIVGGGPQQFLLKRIWGTEGLGSIVKWRENISQDELISEYKQCDVF